MVGTPSRIVAHLSEQNISLQQLEILVIDEADLVLSYGYDAAIRTISEAAPTACQAFLMSATLTAEVDALKKLVLHNPVHRDLYGRDKSLMS